MTDLKVAPAGAAPNTASEPPRAVAFPTFATWPCAIPRKGVVFDMDAAVYHAAKLPNGDPVLGRSIADKIIQSPAHLQHHLAFGDTDTDALRQGRVFHRFLLERPKFWDQTALWDGGRRAGKAWDAFEAEAAALGKDIITTVEFERFEAMARAFAAHPDSELVEDAMIEVSAFANLEGVSCKARADLVIPDRRMIVDLKSASSARPDDFRRDAFKWGYHRQAAWYLDVFTLATGIQFDTFVFVVSEKTAPHPVATYEADAAMIARGRQENAENLLLYKRCQASGQWPSYPQQRLPLTLPRWEQTREDAP